MPRSVTRDGDHIVIRIPREDAFGLRVVMDNCKCCAAKSAATEEYRASLVGPLKAALARLERGQG